MEMHYNSRQNQDFLWIFI